MMRSPPLSSLTPSLTRAIVAAVLLLAGGCSSPFQYNPHACGTVRKGGGPPLFSTRPAELCESARRATHIRLQALDASPKQTEMERTYERFMRLRRSKTVEEFLAGLRTELGDGIADDVAVAIEWSREGSKKPAEAELDPQKVEERRIQAAHKGVRIALEERFIYLGPEDTLSD